MLSHPQTVMDTTTDEAAAHRAPRSDWVFVYGRSPDLRVIALLAFPEPGSGTSGAFSVAHRSQLRGQSRIFLKKHRVPFSPDAKNARTVNTIICTRQCQCVKSTRTALPPALGRRSGHPDPLKIDKNERHFVRSSTNSDHEVAEVGVQPRTWQRSDEGAHASWIAFAVCVGKRVLRHVIFHSVRLPLRQFRLF